MQKRGQVKEQVGGLFVDALVALFEDCAPNLFSFLEHFCGSKGLVAEELDAVGVCWLVGRALSKDALNLRQGFVWNLTLSYGVKEAAAR